MPFPPFHQAFIHPLTLTFPYAGPVTSNTNKLPAKLPCTPEKRSVGRPTYKTKLEESENFMSLFWVELCY